MEVNDIKIVLELAKREADDCRQDSSEEENRRFDHAIEAVEWWLREVGALPPR